MSLLLRHLCSYLIILIIPLTFVFVYFYPLTVDVMENKTAESNLHVIEQIEKNVDMQISMIYRLPLELMNNEMFGNYYLKNSSDYDRFLIKKEMGKYLGMNMFVDDAYLYYRGSDFLYSYKGTSTTTNFNTAGSSFQYVNWKQEDVIEQLNTITKIKVRSAESAVVPYNQAARLVTFLMPVPSNTTNPYATFMVVVNEDTIKRLLQGKAGTASNANVIVLNEDRDIITSIQPVPELQGEPAFKNLVTTAADNHSSITSIDGVDYIASFVRSKSTNWLYLSLVPLSEEQVPLKAVRNQTFLWTSLIIILELIVVYVSLRSNYMPIKRLASRMRQFLTADGDSQPQQKMNEIDTIDFVFRNLSLKSAEPQAEAVTADELRRDFIKQLLGGKIESADAFMQKSREVGLNLTYATYGVSVIGFDGGAELEALTEKLQELELNMLPGMGGCFLIEQEDKRAVFVSSQEQFETLQSFLALTQQQLSDAAGVQVCIGYGTAETSPIKLNNAYREAYYVADDLMLRRRFEVVGYGQLPVAAATYKSYPADKFYSLEFAILKKEAEQTSKIVDELIELMQDSEAPVYLIRSIYYYAITILINGLKKLGELEEDDMGLLNSMVMVNTYNLDDLIHLMKQSAGKLCELMSETGGQNPMIDEMIQYIETNFMDLNLSQQILADKFGMSVSNFSRYFKYHTGVNYKEYVDNLKIGRAKELLLASDEPLEQVAIVLGFSNASNFSRSFKKSTGMTPGEFRKGNGA